jgi:DNA helicase-2/ATP-dependent DNA helicase PcrA
LRDKVIEAVWPADPAGGRRADIDRGAGLVRQAMTDSLDAPPDAHDDIDGWVADVDALLAERTRTAPQRPATLPAALSVSSMVELGRDHEAALRRLNRRLPVRPDPHALLGTAFHDWVQRFYGAERLFDLDDLPGAVDGQLAREDADRLAELQTAFMSSPWAARTPVDVEVPFDMVIGGTVVRGRIDAVFVDVDGTTVVDWKTGDPPVTPEAKRHAAVQLAVYRLAWAALRGVPVETVHAAFHYVRSGETVIPESLPDVAHLAALLASPAA